MSKLKIPSAQHLSRNWRDNPDSIAQLLIRLAQNPPIFNYNPLFGAVRDMLVFGQPYDEIVAGMRRSVNRPNVLKSFLEVLPLIRDHFSKIKPDFVQSVDRRYYPVGRGLMVPFDPPMIYGVGGQIVFPWFSFWRTNPLADDRLSLFVSMVDELLLQDPDLETATFQILDFSAPQPKQPRELTILDARQIRLLTKEEKSDMLSTFAEGYIRAESYFSQSAQPDSESRSSDERSDYRQLPLFGSE